MSQSFFQLYGHLVFSTKGRREWLNQDIRSQVHAYLASTLRDLSCADVHIGGPGDHVHLLFLLPKEAVPIQLIQELKQYSSKFMKTLGSSYADFSWQRGYGLFSVSPTARDAVRNYVAGQIEHHRQIGFQDELRMLLQKAGLEYDEKYLWT